MSKNSNPLRLAKNLKINRVCSICKRVFHVTTDPSIAICKRCAPAVRGKLSSNVSGFIGVHYCNPYEYKMGKYTQGKWESKIVQNGLTIFKVTYKDNYKGTNEYKKLKCAIDRDLHIIENKLPHTRNFTDKELVQYDKFNITVGEKYD